MEAGMNGYGARSPRVNQAFEKPPQRSPRDARNREQYEARSGSGKRGNFNAALSLIGDSAPIRHTLGLGSRHARTKFDRQRRSCGAPLLDQTERGFGYEPGLALLDDSGHVRALADIEAEAIRFAISHYRGQMSEVARRLHIGRSTLYRKLDSLARDAEISGTKAPAL